ncbi:MAG TPA: DUF1206 domain-containing protein [Allosphingosinicella sp.]
MGGYREHPPVELPISPANGRRSGNGTDRPEGSFAICTLGADMNRGKLELLTRLGFAARGLMYIVIGWLALMAGRSEDAKGALEYLNDGASKPLLALMAVGFLFYGLWRLANAWVDGDGHGSDPKGKAVRAGGAASGLIHLGFFTYSVRLLFGDGGGEGGGDSAREGAATAMTLPGGWTLVIAASLCLLVVGGVQLIKAARASFLKHLDSRAAGADWARLSGRIGYASRGIVFLIVAWFIGRAAWHERASEAGGMDAALASLPDTFRLVVAFGLMLFGLFSLIEARHRVIADPARMARQKGLLGD